jgi:hypothetical protein
MCGEIVRKRPNFSIDLGEIISNELATLPPLDIKQLGAKKFLILFGFAGVAYLTS